MQKISLANSEVNVLLISPSVNYTIYPNRPYILKTGTDFEMKNQVTAGQNQIVEENTCIL
jgi:hypothetical protein